MAGHVTSQATFSEKLSLAQYAQGCFLANLGYDRESNLALLDVEDGVSRVPLREDCLFLGKSHYFPASADRGKEFLRVEVALFYGQIGWRCHQWILQERSYTPDYLGRIAIAEDVHFCS